MFKKVYLFLILLIANVLVLARAGFHSSSHGGGGHSHGFRRHSNSNLYYENNGRSVQLQPGDQYVLWAFLAILLFVVTYYYFSKKLLLRKKIRMANNILKNSVLKDKIWNKNSLIILTRIAYLRMQDAWKSQDLSLVDDILTNSCKEKSDIEFRTQKIAGYYNFIHKIKISKIEIVGVQDFENDRYDKFSAYITGTMIDEKVYYGELEPINGIGNKFEDIYYFVRQGNSWLLDDIDNKVSINTFLEILNRGQ